MLSAETIEQAFPDIKKDCDNGIIKQCATLSVLSYSDGFNGHTYKKDILKVFHYGKIACAGNDGKGCFFLAQSYLDKHDRDEFKAFEYYKKSCSLGYADGCFGVAYNYEKGIGTRLDYKKAIKFYQKAIELGDKGSYVNLGIMYFNGNGIKKDVEKAIEYFGIGCDNKIQLGCDLYAKYKK